MESVGPILQSVDFRLTYADCDPAGIVYYAAYYPWFERTYSEWTLQDSHTATNVPELWGAIHIARASGCEYFVPGKLFDPLRCEMRLGKLGRTSFTMVFNIVHRKRDELIAQGHIVLVFIDEDSKPTRIPEGMRDTLRTAGVAL